MKREIKFRTWDRGYLSKPFNPFFYGGVFSANCIFQQFIGAEDKNGKEIYEGDICKKDRHTEMYEIVFYRNAFAIKNEGKTAIWHQEFCNGAKSIELEVIGNIYENPDLLKV